MDTHTVSIGSATYEVTDIFLGDKPFSTLFQQFLIQLEEEDSSFDLSEDYDL